MKAGRRATSSTASSRPEPPYRRTHVAAGRTLGGDGRSCCCIDGNSLDLPGVLRPARPTWPPPSGQVTNAVFGFTSMLINLLRDHQPDGIAVAFDRPEPTFRHERGRRLQGQPRGGARHPPPADGARPPGRRGARRSRSLELAGVEADDIIATLATAGPRPAATTSSSSPATATLPARRGPARQGALQPAGRVRLRALRRGRHRRAHRRHPGAVPAVRRAARRPVRQPARRARRGGEDGGQADQRRTAGSTASSPTSTSRRRSCARTWPTHEAQVRQNAEVMVLRPRRRRSTSTSTSSRMGAFDADEVRELFDFLEFRTLLRPAGRGARRRRRRRRGRARRRRSRSRSRRRPTPRRRPTRARRWLRRRSRRRRAAGAGRASTGRSPLAGLAVRDVASTPARRRGSPATLLDDADGARRARARWSARAAGRSPPTTPRS